MISFVNVNVFFPNLRIFLCVPVSSADALRNSLSTFFIKDKPVLSHDLRSLPRNSPDWTVLDSSTFDIFLLVDELFAKASPRHKTSLSVNNYLCEKLISSFESPITFNERFKVSSVPFFIPDF